MQVIRNEALIVLAYLTRSAEVPDFSLSSFNVFLSNLSPSWLVMSRVKEIACLYDITCYSLLHLGLMLRP